MSGLIWISYIEMIVLDYNYPNPVLLIFSKLKTQFYYEQPHARRRTANYGSSLMSKRSLSCLAFFYFLFVFRHWLLYFPPPNAPLAAKFSGLNLREKFFSLSISSMFSPHLALFPLGAGGKFPLPFSMFKEHTIAQAYFCDAYLQNSW